jgi:hypothetical protein
MRADKERKSLCNFLCVVFFFLVVVVFIETASVEKERKFEALFEENFP